jgi:hypothetical protein
MLHLDAGEDEIPLRTMRGLVDLDDTWSLVAGGNSPTMHKLTVLDGVVIECCDTGSACMLAFHVDSVSEHTSIGSTVELGTTTVCVRQMTDNIGGDMRLSVNTRCHWAQLPHVRIRGCGAAPTRGSDGMPQCMPQVSVMEWASSVGGIDGQP